MLVLLTLLLLAVAEFVRFAGAHGMQIKSTTGTSRLTNQTGIISAALLKDTDVFSWLVQPVNPSAASIQLVFSEIIIRQAELRIFDGTNELANSLFACAICGSLIPPPIYSSSGSVFVRVIGSPGVGFYRSSFVLQYISRPLVPVISLNATSLSMNMGYARFSPMLFNSTFPANFRQQWVIRVPTSGLITFSFTRFSFPATCSARVTIYNSIDTRGAVIFSGCVQRHYPRYWLYSRSGSALVVLTGGSKPIALDFELTYFSDANLFNCGSLNSVTDKLRDRSMVLSDGTLAAEDMVQTGISCTWMIDPPGEDAVTLQLNWVGLKAGGAVYVYDGSSTTAPVLWQGVGPTRTTPPLLTSSGSTLYITYSANTFSSAGYKGFNAAYMTNSFGSVGQGQGYSVMTMSSALDVTPPGNGLNYTGNITYVWNIDPSNVKSTLIFVLNRIDLVPYQETLTLYDGPSVTSPVLGTFTGNNIPFRWFRTRGLNATLKYTSSRTTPRLGGFNMMYYADGNNYHCGFTRNPAVIDAPSMTITDGTSSTDLILSKQRCEWTIAPGSNSTGVFLYFSRLNLLAQSSVSIYEGTVAENKLYAKILLTNAVPAPIVFPKSSVLGVLYETQQTPIGTGFSASYFGISDQFSGPGDGVIKLFSSSMLSFETVMGEGNLTFLVAPQIQGSIYFSLNRMYIPDCTRPLRIYDGPSLSSPLLLTACGTTTPRPFQWLETSSSVATVQFYSPSDFDLSYYSDGPNFHCGFNTNPGRLTAPSMVFTDGSTSSSAMYPTQNCEWLIQPEVEDGSGATVDSIVVEFLSSDLRGGVLRLYEGTNTYGNLLWMCSGCSYIPRTIVAHSASIFVVFSTSDTSNMGGGFEAVYWSVLSTAKRGTSAGYWQSNSNGLLLQNPSGIVFDATTSNTTAAWKLDSSDAISTLTLQPRASWNSSSLTGYHDGRPTSSALFDASFLGIHTCGFYSSSGSAAIADTFSHQRATEYTSSVLQSSASAKYVGHVSGSWDTTKAVSGSDNYQPAPLCKYTLDSDSIQSIIITVNSILPGSGRLRIYGGVYNNDAMLYDSYAGDPPASIVAPCGRALIIQDYNTSVMNFQVDFGFQLSHRLDSSDDGRVCLKYMASLLPKKKKANPWLNAVIGCSVVLFTMLLCVCGYYLNKYNKDEDREDFNWRDYILFSRPVFQRVTPFYPRHTPRIDEFRNKFLPIGPCCVCQEPALRVIRLSCSHGICVEDLKGYLGSALGNIALFPVKCPMHYESCTGNIGPDIAKRVLNAVQYEKFLEFSDRALFGEGMRCIFCNNFVNYPSSGSQAMVECPYCVQRFCIRCKKPWHYGTRCPLDKVDDSLEAWKKDSGAQKCPACHKLIEKDDPDTCNHMVHKITDGIPCVRDRADFCYLCGEEVCADYPHNEVRNAGVNHFPEGVFQKCRVVLQREKDAEREKLRKQKRSKAKVKPSAVAIDMDGWETDTDVLPNPARPSPDRFEQQWNMLSPAGASGAMPQSASRLEVTTPSGRGSTAAAAAAGAGAGAGAVTPVGVASPTPSSRGQAAASGRGTAVPPPPQGTPGRNRPAAVAATNSPQPSRARRNG